MHIPSPDDVTFTPEEWFSGKTRTYLAISYYRDGKEWFIVPEKHIAVVTDEKTRQMTAKRPPDYMIQESFWANLNGRGRNAVYYISEAQFDTMKRIYDDLQAKAYKETVSKLGLTQSTIASMDDGFDRDSDDPTVAELEERMYYRDAD